MKAKQGRFFHSITFWLIGILFVLLIPVVVLSVVINYQFMRSGVERVTASRTEVLQSYMQQIDHELDLAETYMNSLTFNNGTTVYLTDRSSPEFYYAANAVHTEISKTALYYRYLSGFFVLVPDAGLTYTYFTDSTALSQGETIRRFLCERLPGDTQANSGWQRVEIDGVAYLLQSFYSNGIYGGSLLDLDALHMGDEQTFFCMEEDIPALQAGLPRGSRLLQSRSDKCGLEIYTVLDESEALSSLPFLQRYFLLITLVMLLTVPLLFLALRHTVVRPLHRLVAAMQSVEGGDLATRVDEQSGGIGEFRSLNHTFNRMTQEISKLKIAVYEEQLETQRTRLQNLSYQLRPHFMINSLNMAYNMVVSGEHENAARLMRFSASYMRYLLRLQDDFVPLNEELEHLKDYLSIQLLRYEGQFRYEFSVDPFVEDIEIPNMILQNFIENSLKYSIGPDHLTLISLTVEYRETDGAPYAVITVRDNGKGYPDWLLDALREERPELLRDRIGLRNTIQRIKMLYGDRAQYRFYNENGAVSLFVFPLEDEEEA